MSKSQYFNNDLLNNYTGTKIC